MKYHLTTQFPKPKSIGDGKLDIDIYGQALFFELDDSMVLSNMERCKLEIVAADIIKISGFEEYKEGKFRYQEWILKEVKP